MNISNSNLKIKFADVFLFTSLFPFISFNLTNLDTQPFTFFVGTFGIIFSLCSFQINKVFRISLILVLIALFISSFSVEGADRFVIRGLYNYLSIFFYLFIFSYLYKENLINNKLVIFANYVYIFFAIVQIYFPSIIDFFVPSRVGNTFFQGRGLSSLTPEPTHFAVTLTLISFLLLINSGYKFRKNLFLHILNLFSITAIARSTSILLIFAISLFLIFLFTIGKAFTYKYLKVFLSVAVLSSIGIAYSIIAQTRIFRILNTINIDDFYSNIIILFMKDQSISSRIQHLLIPFLAFFRDFGMPHAFNGLKASAEFFSSELSAFQVLTNSTKFMSYMGDWVYSLGFFGIIAFLLIFAPLFRNKIVPNYLLIILLMLLTTSVPVSMPLVPAVIAALYYKNEYQRDNQKNFESFQFSQNKNVMNK